MGREIRRVPANWQHPRYVTDRFRNGRLQRVEVFHPLFDRSFAKDMSEWTQAREAWERGERPEGAEKYPDMTFDDWHGDAPDAEWFVPYDVEGDLPWFQMYETVSEGTPVTPAFATADELIDHLVAIGETHDGEPGDGPWPRDRAEKFVRNERWFPSGVFVGRVCHTAKEGWPE